MFKQNNNNNFNKSVIATITLVSLIFTSSILPFIPVDATTQSFRGVPASNNNDGKVFDTLSSSISAISSSTVDNIEVANHNFFDNKILIINIITGYVETIIRTTNFTIL